MVSMPSRFPGVCSPIRIVCGAGGRGVRRSSRPQTSLVGWQFQTTQIQVANADNGNCNVVPSACERRPC